MGHLSDGALRRMIDEPLAASEADRRHLEGCPGCGERSDRLAADAKQASVLLAVPGFEPDAPVALARVRNLAAIAPAPRRAWASLSWSLPRMARPLALVAAVAVLGVISFGAEPAILTVFQVQPNSGITTVPVTQPTKADVAGLPDLSQYGTTKVLEQGTTQTVLTAAEAKQITGLTAPDAPAGYAGKTVTYTVIGESKVTFTFDAAKAKAAAAAAGKPEPFFPPGVDGTTLTVTVGPAVGEVFGTISSTTDLSNLPLIAGAAKPPIVTSNGVSAAELESFLIRQPGIAGNATLVAEIKAIGDPLAAGNLVIPIPANLATSKPATVKGSSGVLIEENTGLVKGLIWEQGGIVYAVGGHFDAKELAGIADGIQ